MNTNQGVPAALAPERVAILIDVANLYGVAKHQHAGKKVDLLRLREHCAQGREVVSTTAYFCTPPKVDISVVTEMLEREGFVVKHKEARFQASDSKMTQDWTAQISFDAASAARYADTIVLVSGKSGYEDLMTSLKRGGIRVEVCSFETAISERLRAEADAFLPITTEMLR